MTTENRPSGTRNALSTVGSTRTTQHYYSTSVPSKKEHGKRSLPLDSALIALVLP